MENDIQPGTSLEQQLSETPILVPKPTSKLKIPLLILLGLVVVAVLVLVGIQIGKNNTTNPAPIVTLPITTPTQPDLTANWKTYANTKVGFKLKYPQRYSQPGLPSGLGPTIYATGDEDNADIIFGESSIDSIDLVVFPFTGTTDELKNYTKSPILLPSDEKATLIKTLQVGGVTANWYRYGFIRIYFVGKNHGFILNTLTGHNEGEIDQILSTFEFTN